MRSSMFSQQSLPVSQSQTETNTIRRRLSSISLNLKLQPSSIYSSFRRSKSLSYNYMSEHSNSSSIKKWCEWALGWIMRRKPTFAKDLEMNEEEISALGSDSKGSWRHVFYKVTSQIRRKLTGVDNVGLPQTFRYEAFDYNKNFDNGDRLVR